MRLEHRRCRIVKNNVDFLQILKHDLHKVTPSGAPHSRALSNPNARRADGIASWFSRNFMRSKFNKNYVRKSLLKFSYNNSSREILISKRSSIEELFNENDPEKLHRKILHSKLLNFYSESRLYPFSSLKYHLLLTCAIYYNLKNNIDFTKLYLCENGKPKSHYQVIYSINNITWSLEPNKNSENSGKAGKISRLYPNFSETWKRRLKSKIGGDKMLDGMLATIKSWSAALATIEDYESLK